MAATIAMKHILLWLGLAAFASPGAAQQDPAPPAPKQDSPTPEARLEAFFDEFDQAFNQWREEMVRAREEMEKAREKGGRTPAMPMRPDFSEIVARMEKVAAEYAGKETAVPFLVAIIQRGGNRDASKRAIHTLIEHHAASDQIAALGPMLGSLSRLVGADDADALLVKLRKGTKNHDVAAWTHFAQQKQAIESADMDSEEYKHARAILMATMPKLTDPSLAAQIQGAIDLREKLSPGSIAPDIAGVDLDGEEFRLSDYKGKVIFLDFWGDW